MSLRALLAIGILLPLGAQPALAGMYKWVDDDGGVHYTQHPPADRPAEPMKAPPPAPDQPAPQPAPAADKQAEPSEPDGKLVTPTSAQEREALYKKNCEAARNNLQVYTQHRRIERGDQVIVLGDEERQRRIEESKRQIDQYCK